MATLDGMDPTALEGDRLRSVTGVLTAMGKFEKRLRESLLARESATYTVRIQVAGGKVVKATVLADEQIPCADLTPTDDDG